MAAPATSPIPTAPITSTRAVMPTPRLRSTDVALLVAMLTRGRALARKPSGTWFVPGWNHADIGGARVSILTERGLLAPGTRAGVRVLTDLGRDVALNACAPETKERLAS